MTSIYNSLNSKISAIAISTDATTNNTVTLKCPVGTEGMALVLLTTYSTPGSSAASLWIVGYNQKNDGNAINIGGTCTHAITKVSVLSNNTITLTCDYKNIIVRAIAFNR